MSERYPTYDELVARSPSASAWGVFGADDVRGTINFITPASRLRGIVAVRDGVSIQLDWSLLLPDPPLFRRGRTQHSVLRFEHANDDKYDEFFTQASSQWDSLAHIPHPEHRYYNGHPGPDGEGPSRLGVDNWAQEGICSRFVLLDAARYRAASGSPLDPSVSTPIDAQELMDICAHQEVVVEEGDVVLIHTGWTSWYEALSAERRRELADDWSFGTPGLARTDDVARWAWDNRVAALVGDVPALEAMPFSEDSADGFLHYRLIPLLGMAVGELFDLSRLAVYCDRVGRYSGFFAAAPLNMPGGIGSTANSVAVM